MKALEKWVPLFGWENKAEVSDLGRVRILLDRNGNKLTVPRPKPIEGARKGYARITFYKNKKEFHVQLHRAVLLSFCPRPDHATLHAAHLNSNPLDNRLENLIWATAKENNAHKKINGTHQAGPKHHASKITVLDAKKIIKMRSAGLYMYQIARKFGVTVTPILSILHAKHWTVKHLSKKEIKKINSLRGFA